MPTVPKLSARPFSVSLATSSKVPGVYLRFLSKRHEHQFIHRLLRNLRIRELASQRTDERNKQIATQLTRGLKKGRNSTPRTSDFALASLSTFCRRKPLQ